MPNLSTGDVVREIERTDANEYWRFRTWTKQGGPELMPVYEDMCTGCGWMANSLRILCEMEAGLWSEHPDSGGWTSCVEVWHAGSARGLGNEDLRVVQAGMLDLVEAGLAVAKVEHDEYRGEYVGGRVCYRVHWPTVLTYWRHGLQRVFNPDGHVYVLRAGWYYKIGRAKDVDHRVTALKIQLPFPVELMHSFPAEDYVKAEAKLHSIFADERVNGEWFTLEDWQVQWLLEVQRMRGPVVEDWELGQ